MAKMGGAGVTTSPAQNTSKKPMRVLVDWVTCSFKSALDLQSAWELIGIKDLSTLETLNYSKFPKYDVTYRIGMIEYHRNFENERWLLNMSGQGCRQYEISSSFDLLTMFGILVHLNTTFTRIDIAIDDFNMIYTTNMIRQAVYNKQCVTRLEDWGNRTRGKIAHGKDFLTMDNFYLGNQTSRYYLNVYDKKIEREQKMKSSGELKKARIEEELKDIVSWTRTEVRFTYEYANMFVGFILSDHHNLGYYITAFLNEKIVFLKPSALVLDSNRSRLAKDINNHARWWRKFLNNTAKMKLSVYRPDKMLVESMDWLDHSVAPTLAQWAIYKPFEFYQIIDELVQSGLNKMSESHYLKVLNQLYFDKKMQNETDYMDTQIKRMPKVIKERPNIDKMMKIYKNQMADQYEFEDMLEEKKKSASFDRNETDL